MGRFRKSFYFVVPAAAILLGLALVEVGLALFRPVPYSVEWNMFFEPDSHTGYRLRPGSVGHF